MPNATHEQLRPVVQYQAQYNSQPRRFAMPATADPSVWASWRAAFRAQLRARLGALPATRPAAVAARMDPPTQHDGYQRSYLEFESAPGVIVPAWLLVPDRRTGRAPAVVAAHGHGYGADDLVGINADGSERAVPQGYHQDFALALCRRGMVVLAPELSGFGRRREQSAQATSPTATSCHEAAWWGLMLGKPLLGSRVWDTLRALDLLQTLPEVDPLRVGIMGGSGGGMVALFAAALEEQFRAVVVSTYFCTYSASILAIDHCYCNYLPGLLQDGEVYDVGALIAPRPLLIEAGDADPIFPLPGVLDAYAHLQRGYSTLGAAGQLHQDIFPSAHQIGGAQAYDFLERTL